MAQSAGATEYTDYISTEGLDLFTMNVLDITLNNQIVRLQ